MKLTPHEKKILGLIEKNPEIIDDTKKRAKIAKENDLSEKTLRNRIGDLKKYGVISSKNMDTLRDLNRNLKTEANIEEDKLDPLVIIKNNKSLIVKVSLIAGFIGLVYALYATPYYRSTTSMYPALDTENFSAAEPLNTIKLLVESAPK